MSSITAEETIEKFRIFIAQVGLPETIVTDNGRQFTATIFPIFVQKWNQTHDVSAI